GAPTSGGAPGGGWAVIVGGVPVLGVVVMLLTGALLVSQPQLMPLQSGVLEPGQVLSVPITIADTGSEEAKMIAAEVTFEGGAPAPSTLWLIDGKGQPLTLTSTMSDSASTFASLASDTIPPGMYTVQLVSAPQGARTHFTLSGGEALSLTARATEEEQEDKAPDAP
ncbi:MAG: hypothetical protein AAFX85_09070, partial [Pseudomonadota bacterium]